MSLSSQPECRLPLAQLPTDPELERLSEVFKIFSDNSRLAHHRRSAGAGAVRL